MRVYIETYGCQMNEYDSDMIRSILVASGHELTHEPSEADVVLVNTCSVRERAERRVLGRLHHLRGMMRDGAALGVTGCMAQRLGDRLLRVMPALNLVVGTDRYASLPEAIERARSGARVVETGAAPEQSYEDRPPPLTATLCDFVAIMRGCENYCSYCVVPSVRGPERSRPMDGIVREIERLAALGTRDITLLGQNVNSYRDREAGFAELLRRVDAIKDIQRVRFATSHPKDLTDDLIETVAGLPKVCEHVHLPVQSGSDRVLRAMNRSYTRERYADLARRIRERIPGVSITTDIIVGFPGESQQDFAETLSLMRDVGFDSAFMFHYSQRDGTAAAGLHDDVPGDEKIARLGEVIELQKQISLQRNESLLGKTVEVLVEGPSQRDPSRLFGRTRCGRTVIASGPQRLKGRDRKSVV